MAFFMLGGSVGGMITGNMVSMVLCFICSTILFTLDIKANSKS